MPQTFSWISDPSRGEWLRVMEHEPFGSFFSIVPRGFAAYARVFHPVPRDRPLPTAIRQRAGSKILDEETSADESLEYGTTTWTTTAQAFGTVMHAQAQFADLAPGIHESGDVMGSDGWSYGTPEEGNLDIAQLASLVGVLAEHTTMPQAGVAAIWDGWGGLISSAGSARFELLEPGFLQNISSAITSIRHRLPRRNPKPGTGLLPAEIASGPHFGLHENTGRNYILFSAGAAAFADPRWPEHAPWIDESWYAQSPSLLWPDDHAWVMSTEIDYDSTLVAGSTELIRSIVSNPHLEAAALPPDVELSPFGDRINAPDA